jgi:hypothetical protein
MLGEYFGDFVFSYQQGRGTNFLPKGQEGPIESAFLKPPYSAWIVEDKGNPGSVADVTLRSPPPRLSRWFLEIGKFDQRRNHFTII